MWKNNSSADSSNRKPVNVHCLSRNLLLTVESSTPREDGSPKAIRTPASRTSEFDRAMSSQHIPTFQWGQGCLSLSPSLRPAHLFYGIHPLFSAKRRAMLRERSAWQAVRSLHENLQEIRNASAPKRKFAFKKTIAQKNAANSGNGPPEDASVRSQGATGDKIKTASSNEPDHRSSDPPKNQDSLDAGPVSGTAGAITIASLSSTHHRFDFASSEPGSSTSISNIHHSAVDLSDSLSRPFATLAINSVTESLLICGRTSGAAHITGVENSTLIVWSRQVRLHECKNCLVYLRCGSRPIIEDCKGILFTPFPPVYVRIPLRCTQAVLVHILTLGYHWITMAQFSKYVGSSRWLQMAESRA